MANVNDMFLSLIEGLSFQNGVYVDNQKDNETLYEVNRMGSSEALDPQNIKKIVKKTDDAKLFMVDMFDLHIGGQAHKSARARMVFDFVAKKHKIIRKRLQSCTFSNRWDPIPLIVKM